jgi:tetratricopeptide (TPR) repeat protein
MDQNRPLTPQEREWQRAKQQLPPEADSDTLDGSVQLTPEDLARLRHAQSQGQGQRQNVPAPPPATDGATLPAIPLNIPRNTPPGGPQTPNAAELEWHHEKQFPNKGGQPPYQAKPPQISPEALPTLEALPQVSRPSSSPVPPKPGPEALPTLEALPQVQRPQPAPPRPPAQMPTTAPALPNQPRPQPPANQARPQPQMPPQGQQPSRPYQPLGQPSNFAPQLSPEELQWQREKQNYPGMTPQERQWQQEKQAYGAPALTPQELEWQREKQAYSSPTTANKLTPQELEWQRQKQNYGGGAAPLPPPVAGPNPRNTRPGPVPPVMPPPYAGVARPPQRRRGGWIWLLIPLALLLIAAAVVVLLLLVKPGSADTTATATSGVASITGSPAGTATLTGSATPGLSSTPNGTPGVTTGGALNPGQLTATAQAGASPSVATSVAENEDLFNQGKTAYDNKQWLDAITAWEKVDPKSNTYTRTRPLLANAYYNQANDLALKNTTPDSLTQAIGFYNKASGLAPDNADFRTAAENASFYQSGSKAVNSKDWDTAVNLLSQLYSRNPDFRDSVQLYYISLEGQGDTQVQSGNLIAAKDSYSTALGLTFKSNPPDTTALKAKLAEVDAKLNPTPTAAPTVTPLPSPSPTTKPTPTPKPVPTATKKPVPTVTPVPLKPCDKGGSGSNFFAFRTGQPSVPNVPDQGRSGVRGVVLSKSGAPLAGASVRITTGGHSFTSVTDGGGNYFREGLGRGVWTISVVAAPGRTICYAAAGSVMLSGQSGFYGSVDFTESVP